MSKSTKRFRISNVVVVVAMVLIPIVTRPVLAACISKGNPVTTGTVWGIEGSQNLTCDDLGDYNGWLMDPLLDGQRVRILTRGINGSSTWVPTGYTDGQNVTYYYGYKSKNHYTEFKICRSDGACGVVGSNSGF